jgi:Integrase core domain
MRSDVRTASNGKIERFHGLLRQEGLSDQELKHQLHAQEIIGRWVQHYNQQRLHASLNYLTPLLESQQTRLTERKQKLAAAQKYRYQQNRQRRQKELDCQRPVGGLAPKPPGFSALAGPVHPGTGPGGGFRSNGMNRLPVTGRSGCFPAEPYPHR